MNKKTLKRAVIKNLWPLLYKTRCHLISRPFYSGIGSILMFHRVCPSDERIRIQGNSGMEVTPQYLESLIKYLLKLNYKIISLDSVYECLKKGHEGSKFIAFTFDDGYYDNFLYAFPILKKYNIPFTIYVATNYPDGLLTPWWYPLEELILKNHFLEFKEDGQFQKFFCKRLPDKEIAFQNIRALLMGGPYADLLSRVKSFFDSFNIDLYEATKGYMLSWEQIKELNRDEIVTFGAHTVNHLALNRLSEKNASEEILNSKQRLESELQNKVDHFSYPFGSSEEVNEREFSIAKQCGFKTSTTTRWGNIFKKHKDHQECLPRIHVNEKRDLCDINLLSLSINGVIPCMVNKFKRIVTI